ncbi:MAG: hypothetical protein EBT07_03195 [Actinobacteria bacterium]|nr:hypothetical protein [Actinomycetota bacterium]
MATESKEGWTENTLAPKAKAQARGPPRWGAPIDISKITVTPAPPNLFEQLESLTSVMPMGEPAGEKSEAVGTGVGVTGAPGAKRAPRAKSTGVTAVTAVTAATDASERAPRATRELPKFGSTYGELPPAFAKIATGLEKIIEKDKILVKPDVFVPSNRRAFKQFIIQAYRRYILPKLPDLPDPDACAKQAVASKSEVKSFAYQSFVRDYLQRASPYRGALVYHGLGSGKTCTSIATLESLYQAGQKPVYIMTPASLDPNYRDEITKCGPYVFRTSNYWIWVPIPKLSPTPPPEAEFAVNVLGIPVKSIMKRKGVWIPEPGKPANFESLGAEEQRQIKDQIAEHINARFVFIHYNGLQQREVREWACDTKLRNRFDGATIVIDEVHNLTRTINNSGLEDFYKQEPRDLAEYIPKFCNTGQEYRVSYLLYRILCNAVGCKIIALSATPIINFPQEIAILANLLAGDTRMIEVSSPGLDKQKQFLDVLQKHPEVDFVEVIPRPEIGTSTVRLTPVPSGCRKVIDEAGAFRGFIRHEGFTAEEGEMARERNLVGWFDRIKASLLTAGLPALGEPKFISVTRLPDTADQFKEMFIDDEKLVVKKDVELLLMARLSGLVSFYKGGKADLMARVNKDEEIFVDMSDLQLKKYTEQRKLELDKELRAKKHPPKAGTITYGQVTQNQNATFKIFSRAACNFVFPADSERPVPADYRDALKMVGAKQALNAEDDAVVETEDGTIVEDVEEETAAAGAGAAKKSKGPEPPTTYDMALLAAVKEMKARAGELFVRGKLEEISPKFQAIIDRLADSAGPALVYSNFKTLEGVGLFGVALEAQMGYRRLDIVPIAGGGWSLSPETLTAGPGTPRYITYSGDEDRAKRQVLLAIFNGKWSKIPAGLATQVKELTGSKTNLHGEIARVFMITQSGAEGISLANVRQVHIMEAYWNYVRLDQVKGRAVRICSHMDLPPEERNVDIFTYITKFSEKQIKEKLVDETLMNFDGGETTDENILKLLKSKKKLADSLVDIMKQAAVDCELNATENATEKGTLKCYRFAGDPTMEPMFHPLVSVHLSEGAVRARA